MSIFNANSCIMNHWWRHNFWLQTISTPKFSSHVQTLYCYKLTHDLSAGSVWIWMYHCHNKRESNAKFDTNISKNPWQNWHHWFWWRHKFMRLCLHPLKFCTDICQHLLYLSTALVVLETKTTLENGWARLCWAIFKSGQVARHVIPQNPTKVIVKMIHLDPGNVAIQTIC